MNLFVCAQQEFGRDVVKALYKRGHKIVGIAPPPQDRLKDKVTGFAQLHDIPIISDCERLSVDNLPDENIDLVITAFSYWIVSQKILDSTTYGGIGFHPSLLPRHRGREAVRWAWEMGDPVTGGTIYWLDRVCDGGDILLQRPLFIDRFCKDYHEIWDEIYPIGIEMICQAVEMIEAGTAPRIPQDERFVTWEPSHDRPRLKRNDLAMLGGFAPSAPKGDSMCDRCEYRKAHSDVGGLYGEGCFD